MTRALVLGGGGPVGIGWESGLADGLAAAGVALGEADLIVGTSAGSVVGGWLALAAGHDAVIAVSCLALALPAGVSDPMFDAISRQIEAGGPIS
jgi:NTE family protein